MKKNFWFILILLLLAFTQFSCLKDQEEMKGDDYVRNSARIGTSHNTGKDCISCHRFSVGGSVYQKDLTTTNSGAVVKLTTQANDAGTVVAKMTTDKNGNIYSINTIKFGEGLYVSVTGNTGTEFMTSAITGGACNSCHGRSTDKVWAE